MADEYAWTIRGSQPRNEEERSKRKIFLGYLEALLEPVDMKSRFATSFWPHDLLTAISARPKARGSRPWSNSASASTAPAPLSALPR